MIQGSFWIGMAEKAWPSTSVAIDRVYHAPTQDFNTEGDSYLYGANYANELHLTCAAIDNQSNLLYMGQSAGRIVLLSLLDLGTHKPRILGSHGGTVTGICIYPCSPVNLVASCSADSTVRLWTHEPKALHSTKTCLQTLYGHTAAVTCIAAVHEFLVSGGADGAVLLWKPTDSGLMAVPQFQLTVRSQVVQRSLTVMQQPNLFAQRYCMNGGTNGSTEAWCQQCY